MTPSADRADTAAAVALDAFRRIRESFPSLASTLDTEPEQVDLALDIPAQAGLLFPVRLDLQNIDELHLHAEAFWLEWFPCTDPDRAEAYVDAVTGLLDGDLRILEHRRGRRVVRAELQEPEGDGWRTIGWWATLAVPWPRKTFTFLRNRPDSPAWSAFVTGFLEPDWAAARDGCPLDLLDRLAPAERAHAERILIRRLSTRRDTWPVQALGHLRSRAALPRLKELLAGASGSPEAFLALAIRGISGDAEMAARLLAMSRRYDTSDAESPQAYVMVDVVHCLAQLHTPEASARIRELQTSPNHLVAFAAHNVEGWYGEA